MTPPIRITYDPEGDILSVTFGLPTPATGYQICDQIVLRVNPETGQAAGLTIRNFSLHVRSQTPLALTGVQSGEVPQDIIGLLKAAPVNRFLSLSHDATGTLATILQPALKDAVAA